jgi:hypothetical protein
MNPYIYFFFLLPASSFFNIFFLMCARERERERESPSFFYVIFVESLWLARENNINIRWPALKKKKYSRG